MPTVQCADSLMRLQREGGGNIEPKNSVCHFNSNKKVKLHNRLISKSLTCESLTICTEYQHAFNGRIHGSLSITYLQLDCFDDFGQCGSIAAAFKHENFLLHFLKKFTASSTAVYVHFVI